MIKIHPKIWDGERCKFGKVLEKCQNYRFLYIFWDILDKMKDNLGQECVKGLLSFQGQIGTIALDFHEKITVLSSFDPTFLAVPPPKIFSYCYLQNYKFGSNLNIGIFG